MYAPLDSVKEKEEERCGLFFSHAAFTCLQREGERAPKHGLAWGGIQLLHNYNHGEKVPIAINALAKFAFSNLLIGEFPSQSRQESEGFPLRCPTYSAAGGGT